MSGKRFVWIGLAILCMVVLCGCPKKKPASNTSDLNVETTTMAPPTQPSTTDVRPPQTPPSTGDVTEDPLMSADMQIVNNELHRRGFSADVYFDYDQSSLSDDTRGKLSRNAELLKNQPRLNMTIEGHADERGTAEYNLALGERRANAVKEFLVANGVETARLKTVSYGKERPAVL